MYVDCNGAIELKSAPTGQSMRTRRSKQEEVLFLLTRDDAQVMAKELVGRGLTDDESNTGLEPRLVSFLQFLLHRI